MIEPEQTTIIHGIEFNHFHVTGTMLGRSSRAGNGPGGDVESKIAMHEPSRPPKSIHAFTDQTARMDAVALAAAVRSRQLHPREVVESAIARAHAVDPLLRAVAAADYERALASGNGSAHGPFAGVPTFVKDMIDVAGVATRWGTRALDGVRPATKTTGIAQQMFDMGMVCLGKTTLPEFGLTPSTEFPHDEPTRNPWNLDRSAGGSSGGAAALVAAGVVPIAHGADGGGSIRIPAACCGLVGLKPSRGRLLSRPETSRMPVNIVVDGVLTRSVRDTAFYFAEAEKRFRNPRLEPMGHVTAPPGRRLRIGALLDSPSGFAVDAVTRQTFELTVALLEDLGHRIEPMPPPVSARFGDDFVHYYGLIAFAVRNAGKRLYGPSFDKAKLTDLTLGLAALFRKRILRTPGAVLRLRRSSREYAALFERYDIVLSPTVGQVTPPVGHLGMGLPFDVLFPRVREWVGYTPLANATGTPAISLPLGFDVEKHLPVGMMFSAAHGKDALLLQLALEIEEAKPWPSLASTLG